MHRIFPSSFFAVGRTGPMAARMMKRGVFLRMVETGVNSGQPK